MNFKMFFLKFSDKLLNVILMRLHHSPCASTCSEFKLTCFVYNKCFWGKNKLHYLCSHVALCLHKIFLHLWIKHFLKKLGYEKNNSWEVFWICTQSCNGRRIKPLILPKVNWRNYQLNTPFILTHEQSTREPSLKGKDTGHLTSLYYNNKTCWCL